MQRDALFTPLGTSPPGEGSEETSLLHAILPFTNQFYLAQNIVVMQEIEVCADGSLRLAILLNSIKLLSKIQ